MFRRSVYSAAGSRLGIRPDAGPSGVQVEDALRRLADLALSDHSMDSAEAESALLRSGAETTSDGNDPVIREIRRRGYLRDGRDWLTRRGFGAAGAAILRDIMKDLGSRDPGGHHTDAAGAGELSGDISRPYEPGDGAAGIDVPGTILNAIRRRGSAGIPVDVRTQDISVYETRADSRAAVVYCLDLSSTMRIKLKDGASRIRAAKTALWCLYALNRRHFPGDSVHVVGFASMAARVRPRDIPFLRTFDANDDFLHYTNYQAAFRLARSILDAEAAENKRIVTITDGQPSACFADDRLRRDILAEKPYSNFYAATGEVKSKVKAEKGMKLDAPFQVYLCYRHKKVDHVINQATLYEARRCRGMEMDFIVVGDEAELVDYVESLARQVRGRAFRVADRGMSRVLVSDYVSRAKRTISGSGVC